MNCAQRKPFILENILRDIEAHESGRFAEIGAWRKTMPRRESCEDGEDGEEETRHRIAYNFCDQWMDAANHQWRYYPGVDEKEWPIIARRMYRGLNEGWEPDEMTNNFVFNPPPAPPQVSLRQRFKNHFFPKN